MTYDSALYNKDLAPIPKERRTWGIYNYASLWVAMSVCIPPYMLASGLIAGGMSWKQAIGTILLGNLIFGLILLSWYFYVGDSMQWMLPGVPPTGRPVCVAFVVIVGMENGKISYEHIYWDQATVLVQLGLLDPAGLPVAGREAAAQLTDPAIPRPRR